MSGLVRTGARTLSIAEETANQLTHGFGLVLSIAGAVFLLITAKAHCDPLLFIGCCVYAVSLVALYAASTLSHSFHAPGPRHFFRMLDQVCIFLFMAGNFTPFALSYFLQGWLWELSLAMWVLTCAGIVFKVCFRRMRNVATGAYFLMGWIPMIGIHETARFIPTGGLALIIGGGLLYTAGIYFLSRDEKVPYYHAIWHLLVMGGGAGHYCAVLLYVIPAS